MYEVSNRARLRLTDFKDALRSYIQEPYPAPTRKAMQFHLNSYGPDGEKFFTCPDVKYIVADVFLEKPADAYKVIHKDGDWRNNNVENLAWVTKEEYRNMRKKAKSAEAPDTTNDTDDSTIMEAISRAIGKEMKRLNIYL